MLLIVELFAAWFGLSVAVGVPLGRAIRRADVREFPLRDCCWWSDGEGVVRAAADRVVRV